MLIDEIIHTAHIHLQPATLYVYVDDLSRYKMLFNPEGERIDEDVIQVSNDWKKDMGFPDFVIDVSPRWNDKCLSVWVEGSYDLMVLSDWLNEF